MKQNEAERSAKLEHKSSVFSIVSISSFSSTGPQQALHYS